MSVRNMTRINFEHLVYAYFEKMCFVATKWPVAVHIRCVGWRPVEIFVLKPCQGHARKIMKVRKSGNLNPHIWRAKQCQVTEHRFLFFMRSWEFSTFFLSKILNRPILLYCGTRTNAHIRNTAKSELDENDFRICKHRFKTEPRPSSLAECTNLHKRFMLYYLLFRMIYKVGEHGVREILPSCCVSRISHEYPGDVDIDGEAHEIGLE